MDGFGDSEQRRPLISIQKHGLVGSNAEDKVFNVLATLNVPWQYFQTVEWRNLYRCGESIGEADVVVFHPHHGLIVFEIKAGAVEVRDGVWFYASGLPMKQSPFSQARRNRYALIDKLRYRLGSDALDNLTITHAAWFPDVVWRGLLPTTEIPSRAFLLDRTALADPEAALLRLFREAALDPIAWTRMQQQALKEVLAPDCHCLVPLASKVDDAVHAMHRATQDQIQVLRMLRSQSRLLVEGGAGSGKTVLACALAREHAVLGKSVLLTCFNKALAQSVAASLAGVPGITVLAFHELARTQALAAGIAYVVPSDPQEMGRFFREESAELLLMAAETSSKRFDTIIVDEAADFATTWWVALEALGQTGFSWYCFYDRRQSLFQASNVWEPPFPAEPMLLDTNMRNTQAIGELAAKFGHCSASQAYRVEGGNPPVIMSSANFSEMAGQLRKLLRDLVQKEMLSLEQIVVLSPYRHTNRQSDWSSGLTDFPVSTDMATAQPGQLRVGTIQGFKGLEADVVILVGLDVGVTKHPETLYVGASRARAALYVLALDGVCCRDA